ncbi:CoA binding protein [Murinocardiopsis flavida]|uniref:CoA binding protein n=1 Tax=Murinocardiopsis flavida TaxID=645275 RepID=A0A2P8DIJ1_9ACTN|nr:CoA binding protein [Murinocardiopsis flavida]
MPRWPTSRSTSTWSTCSAARPDAGGVADEALARPEVRAVWFQLDVVDHAATERVRAAGRTMVMDRCPAIEWPRLLG